MKKLLITVAFVGLLLTGANAQINKGAIFVGASSNFGYNNLSPDNSSGYTVMNLDLKGGYFIINNLTAGVLVGYTKIDEFSETHLGLFGRYYIGGKIFAGAGYTSISPDGGESSSEIPIEIGYAAFVTENIAIEPAVNYAMGDGYERFGFNIGFSLYFKR